jgi:hypothetical protein
MPRTGKTSMDTTSREHDSMVSQPRTQFLMLCLNPLPSWAFPVSIDLNFSNRPVRTSMPGSLAGESGLPLPL